MSNCCFVCSFVLFVIFFFFKQKTAYEMRISDWSSDVCSSDLVFGSLLEALGRSQVVLKGNTSEMLEGIAEGRYLIGYNVLGSYAQVWAERNRSIGIVLPSDYTLAISRTAIISAAAQHPQEAHHFLDYLLSVRGQRVLTDKGRLFAVRPEVTGP